MVGSYGVESSLVSCTCVFLLGAECVLLLAAVSSLALRSVLLLVGAGCRSAGQGFWWEELPGPASAPVPCLAGGSAPLSQ